MEPYFSIITPTYNRAEKVKRCIRSVRNQVYPHYEHIIVDDASTDRTEWILRGLKKKYDRLHYYRLKDHSERCIAINRGISERNKDYEWILWIDSDDVLLPHYLVRVKKAIEDHPDKKIFSCGMMVVYGANRDQIRPGIKVEKGQDMPRGRLGTTQFIYHKDVQEEVGKLPEAKTCKELADMSGIPGYGAGKKWLGNPWGQDWYFLWYATKKFAIEPINQTLSLQYVRGKTSWDNDEV